MHILRVQIEGYREADCREAGRALQTVLGPAVPVGRASATKVWAINKSPHVYGRSKELYGRTARKTDWFFEAEASAGDFGGRAKAALQAVGRLYPVTRTWRWEEIPRAGRSRGDGGA